MEHTLCAKRSCCAPILGAAERVLEDAESAAAPVLEANVRCMVIDAELQ